MAYCVDGSKTGGMDKGELFEVGDWVRFYRDARLVIAEVRYIVTRTGGHKYLLTDSGEVMADAVVDYKR